MQSPNADARRAAATQCEPDSSHYPPAESLDSGTIVNSG
jgi:hypothetical protein